MTGIFRNPFRELSANQIEDAIAKALSDLTGSSVSVQLGGLEFGGALDPSVKSNFSAHVKLDIETLFPSS